MLYPILGKGAGLAMAFGAATPTFWPERKPLSESESKSNFQVTVEVGAAAALPMWHIRPDFKVFQLAFELIATVGNAVIKAVGGKTL